MFDLERMPNRKPLYFHPGPGGDGIQAVFRFANNYGVSVIRHKFSYGVELAVCAFTGPDDYDWSLNYDTPVTGDVIGWIENEYELLKLMAEVEALPRYRPLIRQTVSGTEMWEFLLSVDFTSREIQEIEAVVYNDNWHIAYVDGVAVEIEMLGDDYRVTLRDEE